MGFGYCNNTVYSWVVPSNTGRPVDGRCCVYKVWKSWRCVFLIVCSLMMPALHEDRQEDSTSNMSLLGSLVDKRKLACFNILFSMNMMYVLHMDSSKNISVALCWLLLCKVCLWWASKWWQQMVTIQTMHCSECDIQMLWTLSWKCCTTLVKMPSSDVHHYRMITASWSTVYHYIEWYTVTVCHSV